MGTIEEKGKEEKKVFVGRESELKKFDEFLKGERPNWDGRGKGAPLLLVMGDEGMGKSALLRAMAERALEQNHYVILRGVDKRNPDFREQIYPLIAMLKDMVKKKKPLPLRLLEEIDWGKVARVALGTVDPRVKDLFNFLQEIRKKHQNVGNNDDSLALLFRFALLELDRKIKDDAQRIIIFLDPEKESPEALIPLLRGINRPEMLHRRLRFVIVQRPKDAVIEAVDEERELRELCAKPMYLDRMNDEDNMDFIKAYDTDCKLKETTRKVFLERYGGWPLPMELALQDLQKEGEVTEKIIKSLPSDIRKIWRKRYDKVLKDKESSVAFLDTVCLLPHRYPKDRVARFANLKSSELRPLWDVSSNPIWQLLEKRNCEEIYYSGEKFRNKCPSPQHATAREYALERLKEFEDIYHNRFMAIVSHYKKIISKGDEYLFSIDAEFEDDLNNGIISEKLKDKFKTGGEGYPISENAMVTKEKDDKWVITDGEKIYIVNKEDGKLNITDVDKEDALVNLLSYMIDRQLWDDVENLLTNIEYLKKMQSPEKQYIFQKDLIDLLNNQEIPDNKLIDILEGVSNAVREQLETGKLETEEQLETGKQKADWLDTFAYWINEFGPTDDSKRLLALKDVAIKFDERCGDVSKELAEAFLKKREPRWAMRFAGLATWVYQRSSHYKECIDACRRAEDLCKYVVEDVNHHRLKAEYRHLLKAKFIRTRARASTRLASEQKKERERQRCEAAAREAYNDLKKEFSLDGKNTWILSKDEWKILEDPGSETLLPTRSTVGTEKDGSFKAQVVSNTYDAISAMFVIQFLEGKKGEVKWIHSTKFKSKDFAPEDTRFTILIGGPKAPGISEVADRFYEEDKDKFLRLYSAKEYVPTVIDVQEGNTFCYMVGGPSGDNTLEGAVHELTEKLEKRIGEAQD